MGNHYADFHEAFRKSFSMAQDPATFVNSANRLTLTAEDESQRSEPNELVIGSHSNVNRASVVPSKRSGSSIARASKKTKPNGRASSESERRSSTPMKKSSVDDKGKFYTSVTTIVFHLIKTGCCCSCDYRTITNFSPCNSALSKAERLRDL